MVTKTEEKHWSGEYKMKIDVYEARAEDIDDLVEEAETFFKESTMKGLTPDPDKYKDFLQRFIGNPYVVCFVARKQDTNEIVGYSSAFVHDNYLVENVGELYQFYICPEARGSGLSRILAEKVINKFEEWNCKKAFVQSYSDIDLKLFENLWSKFGFNVVGLTMSKEF